MTDLLAVRLREVDPAELGRRLRVARQALGLTQAQVAAQDASVAYLSRIEAGKRRPDAALVRRLAERLQVSAEDLVGRGSLWSLEQTRLALDYAELALESGEHVEAEARTREIVEGLPPFAPELAARAHFLRARSLEALGSLDDAILELERVEQAAPLDLTWVRSRIALSRCYREAGDLARAVECAEGVLEDLAAAGLAGSDEAVQLAVTVAAAHNERGDHGHALRLCRRAVELADSTGSPQARAAAYWNASIMESTQGRTAAALGLAQRALALLTEGSDARNLARLRSQVAILELRQDEPDLGAVVVMLGQAGEELAASSAGSVDLARNQLALARALWFSGDDEEAVRIGRAVRGDAAAEAPLLAAEACVLLGQVAGGRGDLEASRTSYGDAVLLLSGMGADRAAAGIWFELGALFEEVDDLDAARDAYRRAAASTGLRVPNRQRAAVPVTSA